MIFQTWKIYNLNSKLFADFSRICTNPVSSPCILAVSILSILTHSTVDRTTRLARHALHVELDWLDMFDTTSATGATRNFVV